MRARDFFMFGVGVASGAILAGLAFWLTGLDVLARDQLMSMRMERLGCYGSCPVYVLTIHGNGDSEYIGRDFVRAKGRHTGRVDDEQVTRLLRRFQRARFFSRAEFCEPRTTDSEGIALTLNMRGRSKQVIVMDACAPEDAGDLLELARAMDQAADVEEWTTRWSPYR